MLKDIHFNKLKLEEISAMAGFSNRQSFYTAFFNRCGVTPKEYRLTHAIMKYLKGETGSTASLTIKRRGTARPFNVSVVRGSVPLHSVSASYMLDETTGYISIGNFGESTFIMNSSSLLRLPFQ